MNTPETRTYPESCQSRNCGNFICPANCQHLPAKQDFDSWAEKGCALILDRHSPTIYTAMRS